MEELKKIALKYLVMTKKQWTLMPEAINLPEKPVMVIYGFQFLGSFDKLKKTLNIPLDEISIPKPYHFACKCSIHFHEPIIDNIEQGILSNCVHHSQFSTEAEIDWQGLGLLSSDLHKEYEFLKTLAGFSTSDMSKFCINHIYPSTIKEALGCDSPSIIENVTEHRKDLVSHQDAHCPC